MGISRFLATTRQTTRLGINLCIGVCLLGALPVMAKTSSQLEAHVETASISKNLRAGDQGPAVTELQNQLDRRGLFPYSKDGVYGPETVEAVQTFQRIRGLEPTGRADAETLNFLGVDPNRLTTGFSHPDFGILSTDQVSANSSREDVRILQRALSSYGFDLAIDGLYGIQTVRAVRAYQRTADLLPVEDFADRATLARMGFVAGGVAGGVTNPNFGGIGGNSTSEGRYIAAIIAGPSEITQVQRRFPNARVARGDRRGEYISLGQFRERSEADAWVELAREYNYEAQVLWD